MDRKHLSASICVYLRFFTLSRYRLDSPHFAKVLRKDQARVPRIRLDLRPLATNFVNNPALHLDLVTLAAFTCEERVRLGVADDLSLGRIPLEFSTQTHRNVREVAYFEHAVMGPDVGDRLLSRLHALDEVRAMVLADLSAINLFKSSFRQRILLEVLDRLSGDPAAVDEEPPFRALEKNAVVAFAV